MFSEICRRIPASGSWSPEMLVFHVTASEQIPASIDGEIEVLTAVTVILLCS
jgi:hypothetical protein